MGERHVRGHDARLEARAEEGIQDHFPDAAHLAKARQQQKRWLDDFAIKDGVRLGPVAKASDVLCNDASQKGKPEIGPPSTVRR